MNTNLHNVFIGVHTEKGNEFGGGGLSSPKIVASLYSDDD